jgi:hypothetical protein
VAMLWNTVLALKGLRANLTYRPPGPWSQRPQLRAKPRLISGIAEGERIFAPSPESERQRHERLVRVYL